MGEQNPTVPALGDFVAERVNTAEGVRYYIRELHYDPTMLTSNQGDLYDRPVIEQMLKDKLATRPGARGWVAETNQGHTLIG